jgi:Ca2+-transporting ATPase
MLINILFSGTFMAMGVLYLFNMHRITNIVMAQSVAFTSIVVFEMMRVYIIRSNYKLSILSNKPLLIAVVASILLQIAVIYTPVINEKVFKSVPISLYDWGWIILVGLVTIVMPNLLFKKIFPKMTVS